MKGKNLEELLNKKVNIESFSGKKYEGIIVGYVPAQDNDPEIEEISIKMMQTIKYIHYLKTK